MEKIESMFNSLLEEKSLEDIAEDFDLTPIEVLKVLFSSGFIDEELLERSSSIE